MTFSEPDTGSGSSNYTGLGAGTSTDGDASTIAAEQLYETQRRLHLIQEATDIAGQPTIDPNLAYQVAQQDIPDDELVDQVMRSQTSAGVEQAAQYLEDLPESARIGYWKSLPKSMHALLIEAGVDNPMVGTKRARRFRENFEFFGHGVGAFGDAVGGLIRTAGDLPLVDATQEVGGAVLHGLNVAGDTIPHLWRASSENEQSQGRNRELLLDADLRYRTEQEAGRSFTDDEWRTIARPFWEEQAADPTSGMTDMWAGGGGQNIADFQAETFVNGVDPNTIDPNLTQFVIDTGNELRSDTEYRAGFAAQFDRTATGGRYVPPNAQIAALDHLGGDWEQLQLAVDLASGDTVEDIAARTAEPDTPEFFEEFMRVEQLVNAEGMQEAVDEMASSKITVGRTMMRSLGVDETAPGDIDSWFGFGSGIMDAAVMVWGDPTLLAGKMNTSIRLGRIGLSSMGDATTRAERAIAFLALDGDEIAQAAADPALVAHLDEALHSSNLYNRVRALDQRHIARQNWRAADSFAEAFRALDGGELGNLQREFLARNPGVSRGFSSMIPHHIRIRDLNGGVGIGHGLDDPARVLRFFGEPRLAGQLDSGYTSLTGGKMSRFFRQEVMLPRQTSLQARGISLRYGARSTLDEIARAGVLKDQGYLGTLRRRSVTRLSDDALEELVPETAQASLLRKAAETGIRIPFVGRSARFVGRLANDLATHVPLRQGFQLSGDDFVDEIRKYVTMGRSVGMTPDEVESHFIKILGAGSAENPLQVMQSQLLRAGFDDEHVATLLRQAAPAEGDGLLNIRGTLDDLAEMGKTEAERSRLTQLAERTGNGSSGINISGRRRALMEFTRDFMERAGVDKTVDGQKWMDEFMGSMDSQHYSTTGLDTVLINGGERNVGILPMADYSGAMELPQFRDFLHNTQRGHIMRRVHGIAHNDFTNTLTSYWKASVVLRLGFVPRAAGEEMLSYVLREGPAGFVRGHLAAAAMRDDWQQVMGLNTLSWTAGLPGRAFRHLTRNQIATRRAMMEEILKGLKTPAELAAHEFQIGQQLMVMQDATRAAAAHAEVAKGVTRLWSYNRFTNAWREPTVRFVKGWEGVATAQMRVAEMGPVELMANYLAGQLSRGIRKGLTHMVPDELLASADEMLHDPVIQQQFAGMLSGESIVNRADRTTAQTAQLDILRDQSGVPILHLDFVVPQDANGFRVWELTPSTGPSIEGSWALFNELQRMFSDLSISRHLAPATQGYVSTDMAKQIATQLSRTSMAPGTRPVVAAMDAERAARFTDRLAPVSGGNPIFTEDGHLVDWFLEDYDTLIAGARSSVRQNVEGAEDALNALNELHPYVLAERGDLNRLLSGEVTEQDLVRMINRAKGQTSDPEQLRVLNDALHRVSNGKWGTVGRRDEVLDLGRRTAERTRAEAADHVGNEANVTLAAARNVGDPEVNAAIDRLAQPNEGVQSAFRATAMDDISDVDLTRPDWMFAQHEEAVAALTGYRQMLAEGNLGDFVDDVEAVTRQVDEALDDLDVLSEKFELVDQSRVPQTSDVPEDVPAAGADEMDPAAADFEVPDLGQPKRLPYPGTGMDVDVARAQDMAEAAIQSAPVPGAPSSYRDAQTIDALDPQVQSVLDELMPGWDNEATNTSTFLRGRSDEVIPHPQIDQVETFDAIIDSIEKMRTYTRAMPPKVQEAMRRVIRGDHNMTARAGRGNFAEQMRILAEGGADHTDLATVAHWFQTADESSVIEEVIGALYQFDPHIAYVILDDAPVWIGTQDDLFARLVAAGKRAQGDPDVMLTGQNMDRLNQMIDGTPRARPVPLDHRRMVAVTGDKQFADNLATYLDNADEMVDAMARSGIVLNEQEVALLRHMLDSKNFLSADAVQGYEKAARAVGDSVAGPLAGTLTDDFDVANTLKGHLSTFFNETNAGARGIAGVGYVDIPRMRELGSTAEELLTEVAPGIHTTSPLLLGDVRPYNTTMPAQNFEGGLAVGATEEAIYDEVADTWAKKFLEVLGTPDGGVHHQIIGPGVARELTVDTIRETPSKLLPQTFVAPDYAIPENVNWFNRLIQKGFRDFLSPGISTAVRQPMFLQYYHKAKGQLRPIMEALQNPELERIAQDIVDRSGLRNTDELMTVLRDKPAEFWDNGQSMIDSATLRAADTRMENPEALELFGNFDFVDSGTLLTEGEGRPLFARLDKEWDEDPASVLDRLSGHQGVAHDPTGAVIDVDQDVVRWLWKNGFADDAPRPEIRDALFAHLGSVGLDSQATAKWLKDMGGGRDGLMQWVLERQVARVRWERATAGATIERTGDMAEAVARVDGLSEQLGFLTPYVDSFPSETRALITQAGDVRKQLIERLRANSINPDDTGLLLARELDQELSTVLSAVSDEVVDVVALQQMGAPLKRLRGGEDMPAHISQVLDSHYRPATTRRRGAARRTGQESGDFKPGRGLLGVIEGDDVAKLRKWARNVENREAYLRREASQQAMGNMLPFIDDSNIRSYFAEYVYNLMPFYFAQEQFLRRWARTFIQTPEAVRRGQLGYQALQDSGIVKEDADGNAYLVYPMPEGPSNWLAQVPYVKNLFGDSLAIPHVLDYTGEVRYALPGVDAPFALPSLGPLGAIPMTALTNAFPELEPVERTLLTERGINRSLPEMLVPSWAHQTYNAVMGTEGAESALTSATVQAMMSLEAEGTRLRLDAEEALADGNAELYHELSDEANQYSLPGNPTTDQIEEWVDRVKGYARRTLVIKGLLSAIVPASPRVIDTESLQPEFRELLNDLPFEQAVGVFLARHPEGMPFTISATDNPSMAQVPPAQSTSAWLDENQALVEDFPLAAPWFIPASDSTNENFRAGWTDIMAQELRRQRTPIEWYRQLKFAAGAEIYFRSQEAHEAAMLQLGEDDVDGRREETAAWDRWRIPYLAQHQLFASQLNGESQSQKEEIFSQLSVAVRAETLPPSAHMDAIRTMVFSYENFASAMGGLRGNQTSDAEETRFQLRSGLYAWGSDYIIDHPEASGLWYSIIQPLAGLRRFGLSQTIEAGSGEAPAEDESALAIDSVPVG